MKKTKLLMPILGVATITGVVTPIVVSCNNSKKLEIDVTDKRIETNQNQSAEFEFIWNSFNTKKKKKLLFENMTGVIRENTSQGSMFGIDIDDTTRDTIAASLCKHGGDGKWKGSLSFQSVLDSTKEYVAEFKIDYKYSQTGSLKHIEIKNIIVTYNP